MKKIAVLSDIHSNEYLFKEILKDLEKENIDDYIFLGDYVTDGPNANQILEKIKKMSKNVITGNREKDLANYFGNGWEDNVRFKNMLYTYQELTTDNLEYLKKLPLYQIIEINGVKICYSHGTPYQVDEDILDEDFEKFDRLIADFACDVYLFGHQHRPFAVNYRNCWFINPGSVSIPLDNQPTSKYGILLLGEKIAYQQKSILYNLPELKKYYMQSDYFESCFEWANLLFYAHRDAIDYRTKFINEIINQMMIENIQNTKKISQEMWKKTFFEFMEKHNLEMIGGVR